jgi:putative hydrolase of the HAD superfamily
VLLALDLDNTLIDRASAFARWAAGRYGPAEVPWLQAVDEDGFAARTEVAARIAKRYGDPYDQVLTELREGMADHLVLDPLVPAALREATSAGLVPVVVTNGTVSQQEAKLRRTGLSALVAGWVISEGAGVRKPDRAIFELAARLVPSPLSSGGWMVGDNPGADIGGGAGAGLRTVWLPRGRAWPASLPYMPTLIAPSLPAAVAAILRTL